MVPTGDLSEWSWSGRAEDGYNRPPRLFFFNSSGPSLCLLYPVTHLDCARDLYGSPPPDNKHRAHSTLCQGLQGWLGDVGRLQRNIFLIYSLSCAKIIPVM